MANIVSINVENVSDISSYVKTRTTTLYLVKSKFAKKENHFAFYLWCAVISISKEYK